MKHKAKIIIIISSSILLLLLITCYSLYSSNRITNDRAANELVTMPNLADGPIQNITFKSKIDNSSQFFSLKLPKGYTPKKKWPLLVTLHGLGDGPILAYEIDSIVQIGPYGRGSVWYTGIGEKDIFECIEITKKICSIDPERIYLSGFSMGGEGVFRLGLTHPDFWAACVPVCGRWENIGLVENARDLPFWINTGKLDDVLPPELSKKAYEKAKELDYKNWRYSEYEGMGHEFYAKWEDIEPWLLTKKRIKKPQRVTFCCYNPDKSWWAEIIAPLEYGKIARIDASIEGQAVNVTTENVSNYKLHLNEGPIKLSKEIHIRENGKPIYKGLLQKDGCFIKKQINDAELLKVRGLTGPLWDIYSSPAVLVYGTESEDKSLMEAAKSCATSFCNPAWMDKVDFKIIPDKELTEEQIKGHNIVLFGNSTTNIIIKKIEDKLPVRLEKNTIIANGTTYESENVGFVLIYPNPLNRQRYVAVLCGNNGLSIDSFNKIWPDFSSVPKSIDFGIFEILNQGQDVRWLSKGVFDSHWK